MHARKFHNSNSACARNQHDYPKQRYQYSRNCFLPSTSLYFLSKIPVLYVMRMCDQNKVKPSTLSLYLPFSLVQIRIKFVIAFIRFVKVFSILNGGAFRLCVSIMHTIRRTKLVGNFKVTYFIDSFVASFQFETKLCLQQERNISSKHNNLIFQRFSLHAQKNSKHNRKCWMSLFVFFACFLFCSLFMFF